MTSLNVLVVDNTINKISTARIAFKESFKQLNEHAELGILVNIFPIEEEYKKFTIELEQKVKDSKQYNNYNLVANYIKKYIEQHNINTILLDFLLTVTEENTHGDLSEDIENTSGAKILQSLRESRYKNIPCIGYTQLNNQLPQLKIGNFSTLFQINKVDFTENYFIENQGHLHNILFEAERYQNQMQYMCDIVVLCALKKELKPILELLQDKEEIEPETFAKGYIVNTNGNRLKVIAITKEQMGMPQAATLASQMIAKHNPSYIVMTGIAAGIEKNGQNFLDTLIPKYIHNWQSGKYKVLTNGKDIEKSLHVLDKDRSPVYTYAHNKVLNIDSKTLSKLPGKFLELEEADIKIEEKIDILKIKKYLDKINTKKEKDRSEFQKEILSIYELEQKKIEDNIKRLNEEIEELKEPKNKEKKHSENLEEKEKKLKEEEKNLSFSEKRKVVLHLRDIVEKFECKIHSRGMVSGSAVVADSLITDTNIVERHVDGIDMEAYGVAYSCNHSEKESKVIIIKSICDFADEDKNDVYQSAAAYVSAQVFYELFTNIIDVEPQS